MDSYCTKKTRIQQILIVFGLILAFSLIMSGCIKPDKNNKNVTIGLGESVYFNNVILKGPNSITEPKEVIIEAEGQDASSHEWKLEIKDFEMKSGTALIEPLYSVDDLFIIIAFDKDDLDTSLPQKFENLVLITNMHGSASVWIQIGLGINPTETLVNVSIAFTIAITAVN